MLSQFLFIIDMGFLIHLGQVTNHELRVPITIMGKCHKIHGKINTNFLLCVTIHKILSHSLNHRL